MLAKHCGLPIQWIIDCFNYFSDLCDTYALLCDYICTKYLVSSMYVFTFVSTFVAIIVIIGLYHARIPQSFV